jgi:hypothetical protein
MCSFTTRQKSGAGHAAGQAQQVHSYRAAGTDALKQHTTIVLLDSSGTHAQRLEGRVHGQQCPGHRVHL